MNYEEIVCDANNLYRAYKVSVKKQQVERIDAKIHDEFPAVYI